MCHASLLPGVDRLHSALTGVGAPPAGVLEQLLSEHVGKPLLLAFADPTEKCRALATQTMLELLPVACGAVSGLLPYAVPVLADRLERKSVEHGGGASAACGQAALSLSFEVGLA